MVAAWGKVAKRSKYSAKKCVVDGVTFDSQAEAARYVQLRLLERAGQIKDLTLQPRFKLSVGDRPILIRSAKFPNGRHATAVMDFQYYDMRTLRNVVEDVKGMDNPTSRLKRAIVEAQYGVEVVII